MQNDLSNEQLGAWRSFITAHATIIERIDQELQRAQCVPLHWYDVLIELYEAPEQRLRMSELASRVVLSRSTLTHLAERMEGAGLIARQRSDSDRRGAYAVLTEPGLAALRQAWPVYAQGILVHFAQHLHPSEVKTLHEALTRVLDAARSH